MRYAIFSDIHGNWQAWNAVLTDMYDSKVDVPVCLGDVVGYGPCPQKVLDGIREVTTNFVMGNHDAAASGVIDAEMFNDTARAVIEWTRDQLNEEALEFLKDMALVIEDGELLFVHAEIEEPGRFYYIDSEEEAQDNFQYCTQRITFVGHTHDPAIFAENEDKSVTRMEDSDCVLNPDQRYIINVGSVGEPRNPEDIRARYVIFDTETNELSFRRIEFDIEGYRKDLLESGLSIKPYFLTVVDSYLEAVEMAKSADGQMMRDMKTPVHAPTLLSQRKRRIVSSHQGRPPLTRKPLPIVKKSPAPAIFMTIFLLTLAAAAGWYFWWLPKQEAAGEIAITQDDSTGKGMAGMIADELNGGVSTDDSSNASEPDSVPTRFADKETINHWNFDNPEGEIGEETLFVTHATPEPHERLIVKIPKTGTPNHGAAKGGIWTEPSVSGQYSIRTDRSWTFEGWFKQPEITSLRAQFVIAGNRGHTGSGWRLDTRKQDGQVLNFSYWPDGISKNAHHVRIPAAEFFDDKPHHFAVVWDRNFEAGETGQIRIYVDGQIQVGKINGKTNGKGLNIPLDAVRNSGKTEPFSIGGILNTTSPLKFTGALDEFRFTAGVQKPEDFLVAKDGKLPPPVVPVAEKMAAADAPVTIEEPKPDEKVEALDSLRESLIYYAPLDEPTGAKVLEDLSVNGRHTQNFQAEIGHPGKVGNSAHFLKGGMTTRTVPMSRIDTLTIAFWIKLDEEQVVDEIPSEVIRMPNFFDVVHVYKPFGAKDSKDLRAILSYPESSKDPRSRSKLSVLTTGKKELDTKWHHVVITNDAKEIVTYVDGQKMANVPKSFLKLDITHPGFLGIGRTRGDTNGEGNKVGRSRFQLDEIAIWRRNLTEEERLHLFKMGESGVPMLEEEKPVTYWKFDGNLEGGSPIQSIGELPNFIKSIEIAPATIPLTLEANSGGLRITHLKTPEETAADFAVSKDQGFTYEGWFRLNPNSKSPRSLATLGATTENKKNEMGWKLGAIPTRNQSGNLIFLLESGPNNLQIAQATEQPIFDRKPHHIAAVWERVNSKTKAGQLLLYIDGKKVGEKKVAEADVPSGKPNPLEIGGKLQDIFVDEIRFTATALNPANFLIGYVPDEKPKAEPAKKK